MARQGKYTKKVSPARKAKRGAKRQWRWFKDLSRRKKALLFIGPVLAFLVLTPIFTYLYYANDISDPERLMNRNNTGIELMDRDGQVFYSTGRAERRVIVPLDKIAGSTKDALIASEDKDFYSHPGFSAISILGALYANVTSGNATGYGGSTLTQQLAKTTLLSADKTFFRKYKEIAVAVAIEQRYTKDEILDMYLNTAFFGGDVFGIDEAARTYFNKAPADLTLAESAILIGLLPAPNAYSPIYGNAEYAKERQVTVLTRMVTNKKITQSDKQAALAQAISYASTNLNPDMVAPHFTQMVLDELGDKYGAELVARSGYQVRTTLDLNLQKELTANIASHLKYIQNNGGTNASAIAIDPRSGEVRALVGSADWNNPQWGKVNMATSPRQPGSSFKPIYYSKALADNVITPATILADVPTDFGNGYTPQNATRTFSGNVTVRNALARSLNIPSIKVMQKYGIDKTVAAANKMGISIDATKTYGLSLALGAAEAPLDEMTNAYAAFAHQGEQYNRTIITQVEDKYNKEIFKAHETSKRVVTKEGAYLISSILSDNNARAPIFGSSLTVSGHTAAVKTGTTDDQRDAWTIGYTPTIAVGVWVGNNDNSAMKSGGSDMAGPIWVNTMRQALADTPNTDFPIPAGITQRSVCIGSEALATRSGYGTYSEYFLALGLPTATCTPADAPKQPEKTPEEEAKPDSPKSDAVDGSTEPSVVEPTTPPATSPVVPPKPNTP